MTRIPLPLVLLTTSLLGCAEHWYAHDEATLDVTIEEVAYIDAQLLTPPTAWPDEDLYGSAVRVMLAGESVAFVGEVRDGEVLSTPHDIDDSWGDNVNILDAWDGCSPVALCQRTFRLQLACGGGRPSCQGTVEADAFLSIQLGPYQAEEEGHGLELELLLVEEDAP